MNLIETAKNYASGAEILLEWTVTGRVVSQAEAQSRADLCLKCPKHNPNGSSLKSAVAGTLKKILWLKKNLKLRVHGEKSLGECSVCDCVLRSKIWMELDTIRPSEEEKGEFWPECWLLK